MDLPSTTASSEAVAGATTPAQPERYICVHGHFYQPPRENPWLEAVETQDSAAPYHDWNERITAECYAPNGASRIVNHENKITRILNNYARISFNFGPTLLSWLATNAPRAYKHIQEADTRSQARFGGHGSAMAQVYNHIIMPLANTRDRITQIRWGIADFQRRFGRKPEGMWLSETAVDNQTLELLAQHGILFTVLAPSQCARVRSLAARAKKRAKSDPPKPDPTLPWQETPHASVDTTRPYLVRLKSGNSIAVFFYDGPRSRAIAFEGLLNSGDNFAGRLQSGFRPAETRPGAQLVHVATDGESYGHHHRYGDMALTYALFLIEQGTQAKLTNYGEFLAKFPPEYEAEIYENTSWSCFHGVERWGSDCGCNGGRAGWNQKWRTPLRRSLDWLRDTIAPLTEHLGSTLFKDVWAARNAYIEVVLHRENTDAPNGAVSRFFELHAHHALSPEERIAALKLMELQRHALLMYTSCGWFFDDISGIETVQIIAYAARVLQLAGELFGSDEDLERQFLDLLRPAKSNDPSAKDGAEIYLTRIKPKRVGLEEVTAHYAISSVFATYPESARLFCYNIERIESELLVSGRSKLVVGRANISSELTGESESAAFAALHFGDQNISAAVRRFGQVGSVTLSSYEELLATCRNSMMNADMPGVVRLLDNYFAGLSYSLTSLFTDEQRRILKFILNTTIKEVENTLSSIYEGHASLLHYLSQAGLPKPPALTLAAGFAVNIGFRHALEAEHIDMARVQALLLLAKSDKIELDAHGLGYIASQRMKHAMIELHRHPDRMSALDHALSRAKLLTELPFEFSLWQSQNIWYDTLELTRRNPLPFPSEEAAQWMERFNALGQQLRISVSELVVEDDGGLQLSDAS